LFHAITELGGSVAIFSPDRRTEGFGLNTRIVREAHEQGVELLVCLDYGSLAVNELALVKHLGMQGAVIDHHHLTDNRAGIDGILVNPHQEGCNARDSGLTSAGLSWVVARELLTRARGEAGAEMSRDLSAIAAIGTVADVGDCTLANRALTAAGLKRLQECMMDGSIPEALTGIVELVKAVSSSRVITSRSIGFGIGPTINAAGRIAEAEPTGAGSAHLPIRILCGQAPDSRSADIAELVATNARRRVLSDAIADEARKAASEQGDREVLVVGNPTWHEGVVGIVAARLAEEFRKPAFVFGGGLGGIAKGSGRNPASIQVGGGEAPTFDLAASLDNVGPGHANGWGGHANAAGVVTKFSELSDLQDALCAQFRDEGMSRAVESRRWSSQATLAEVATYGAQFCREAALLEPCDSRSNPAPHLRIEGVLVAGVTKTSQGGTLVTLRQPGDQGADIYVTGRLVGSARQEQLTQGERVSVVATVHLDRYRHAKFRSQDVLLEISAVERDAPAQGVG
jgi:single-stranded-DNA-specific exonuclease